MIGIYHFGSIIPASPDDINRTITRDRLSSDVLSDINRTITKSMLSQEVLDELNASGGVTVGIIREFDRNGTCQLGTEIDMNYFKSRQKEFGIGRKFNGNCKSCG